MDANISKTVSHRGSNPKTCKNLQKCLTTNRMATRSMTSREGQHPDRFKSNISKTDGDRDSAAMDHPWEIAFGVSNSHAPDDVT